jgi:hypothetical protein
VSKAGRSTATTSAESVPENALGRSGTPWATFLCKIANCGQLAFSEVRVVRGSRNMPTGGLGLAGVHLVFGGGMMFLTRIQRGTRVPTGGPPVDERAHPYAVLREVLTT